VIHVFGITHAGAAIPEGMDGLGDPASPVRAVEHDRLAAVVCDLEQPPRSRAALDRHQKVQSELVQTMTLVPLRFGTLMDSEQELVEGLLTAHAAELRELVASVDGRVQLTLKAIYHEDVPLREAVKAHPDLKRTSDRLRERDAGRDAWVDLGQRVARAIEAHRAADETAIVARLEPHAERVLVEEPGHERMVARLQLLVPRDRREGLDQAVAALIAEQEERMSIRYIGPLAPYSFCDVSLDAEAAWG
jgi:Gas vesicle synthesis protein GvpL/GvpF